MASYTGTSGNDSWTVINPGTFSLDGGAGVDTLYLGTSLRSSYSITRDASGAVHVDSVSSASGGALHATLTNMEKLVFASGRDTLDLTTAFGNATPTVEGTSGNDVLDVGSGSHSVDGLGGIDTVRLAQPQASYTLGQTGSGYTLTAADGSVDTLANVERLQFSDGKLALDLDGHAGEVARILGAVFGPASVANATYAGIGLQYLDGGMDYQALCALAVAAAGLTTPEAIVGRLWSDVVGSAPTAAEAAPYVAMLDSGTSVGALTAMAADTALNAAHIDLVGLAQHGLEFL